MYFHPLTFNDKQRTMIHPSQHLNIIEISPFVPKTIFKTHESVSTHVFAKSFSVSLPLPKFPRSIAYLQQEDQRPSSLINQLQSIVLQ